MEEFAHGLITTIATEFDLLPERIDLVGFVLQVSGLFAILGTAALLMERRLPRWVPRRPERWTVIGAAAAVALFALLRLVRELH